MSQREDPYKLNFRVSSNLKINVLNELAWITDFKKWYWLSKSDHSISLNGHFLPKKLDFLHFACGWNFSQIRIFKKGPVELRDLLVYALEMYSFTGLFGKGEKEKA